MGKIIWPSDDENSGKFCWKAEAKETLKYLFWQYFTQLDYTAKSEKIYIVKK